MVQLEKPELNFKVSQISIEISKTTGILKKKENEGYTYKISDNYSQKDFTREKINNKSKYNTLQNPKLNDLEDFVKDLTKRNEKKDTSNYPHMSKLKKNSKLVD